MDENTCCFTGHRKLPSDTVEKIILNLDREVENLIAKGITDFISGGALGFDQIAASLIVAKKETTTWWIVQLIVSVLCFMKKRNGTNCTLCEKKRIANNQRGEMIESNALTV